MSILKSEERNFILSSIIILVVLILGSYTFLHSHYVSDDGLCADILYYQPLSIWGRIIFVSLGILASIGNLVAFKILNSSEIRLAIIAIILCLLISFVFGVYGNQILGSRTEHWPQEYKVQPLNNDKPSIVLGGQLHF